MEIALIIIAFILFIVGIIGSIIPGLPGPPVSYIGLVLIKLSGRSDFSIAFLIIWAVVAIAVTIMDYILPSMMTKKFGGSKAASIGSLIGLIAGIVSAGIFGIYGIILGPFLGAFIGELIHNSSAGGANTGGAFKAALGAFLAFFVGTGAKLIICLIMLIFGILGIFNFG